MLQCLKNQIEKEVNGFLLRKIKVIHKVYLINKIYFSYTHQNNLFERKVKEATQQPYGLSII